MSVPVRGLILVTLFALFALFALGCQSEQSITCDNGTVCGVGFVCAPAGYCALPDQISACADKADGDGCSLSLGEGFCEEGSCQIAQCGNGRLDVGEACDDGNDIDTDACSNNCAFADCGDGIVQDEEDCDAGAANADDQACTTRCLLATCGDGLLFAGAEDCDSGMQNADERACTADCQSNTCGDGKLWQGVEACDDGNAVSGDGCRDDCRKVEVCGDALVDTGESCDDGNVNAVDGCDACQASGWTAEGLLGAATTSSGLSSPAGTTHDSLGNLFIADAGNQRVLRMDAQTGSITTIAGSGTRGFSGDGGPATGADLDNPVAVSVDGLGNLFISDQNNHRIRRVDAQTSIITTVAGSPGGGYSGDGGPATSARLAFPQGIAVDGLGHLFVADQFNNRIRRVDGLTGIITTVAGTGSSGNGGDSGPAISAQLFSPTGIAIDLLGNLFILGGSKVRRVDAQTGVITSVAGTGSYGFSGDGGPAITATFAGPIAIALDASDNIYVADQYNNRIRRIDAQSGIITTVAGSATGGFSGDGGPATTAELNDPLGISVGPLGSLLIADRDNSRIRRVDAQSNEITTVVGGTSGSSSSMAATGAKLDNPEGLALDAQGNLYFADETGQRVGRIDAQTGILTAVAGTGTSGFSGDDGPATAAQLSSPTGIALDSLGHIYIAEQFNQRIRRVDAQSGIITTVAGNGSSGFSGDGGPATAAQLSFPRGVAVDALGNILIADQFNQRIRRVDAQTGIISTIVGTGAGAYSGDGGAATSAAISGPTSILIDTLGHLYIADRFNNAVRRVDAQSGIITTVAGTGNTGFSGDGGLAIAANLSGPTGVAMDALGHLFIADRGNQRVRRVDAQSGLITTVAGIGTRAFSGEGGAATNAGLADPYGIALDAAGNLFISDAILTANRYGRITRVDASTGDIAPAAGAVFPSGSGLAPDARLATPVAMVVTDWATFFAGSLAGTVQRLTFAEADLASVVGRHWPQLSLPASGNRARYQGSSFGSIGGVAYNAADGLLYFSETSNHRIHVVAIDDSDNGVVPGNPNSWTIETLAGDAGIAGFADGVALSAEFREPRGLFFNEVTRKLYVADAGNHVIRVIDIDVGTVSTIAGTPQTLGFFGDGGDALDALLFEPTAMTECTSGDLFIADTGSHRVRRIEAGTGIITSVIGVGIGASSGEGSPASTFPVDEPQGLACDDFGNLFVASGSTVRLLPADDTGLVDGSGPVQTIYGAPPRDTFPASVTSCLTGIAITVDNNGAQVLQATDSCTGILVELTRGLL